MFLLSWGWGLSFGQFEELHRVAPADGFLGRAVVVHEVADVLIHYLN